MSILSKCSGKKPYLVLDAVSDVSLLQTLQSVDDGKQLGQVVHLLPLPGVSVEAHLLHQLRSVVWLECCHDKFVLK